MLKLWHYFSQNKNRPSQSWSFTTPKLSDWGGSMLCDRNNNWWLCPQEKYDHDVIQNYYAMHSIRQASKYCRMYTTMKSQKQEVVYNKQWMRGSCTTISPTVCRPEGAALLDKEGQSFAFPHKAVFKVSLPRNVPGCYRTVPLINCPALRPSSWISCTLKGQSSPPPFPIPNSAGAPHVAHHSHDHAAKYHLSIQFWKFVVSS